LSVVSHPEQTNATNATLHTFERGLLKIGILYFTSLFCGI